MSEFCRIVAHRGRRLSQLLAIKSPGGSVSIGGSAFRLFLRFLRYCWYFSLCARIQHRQIREQPRKSEFHFGSLKLREADFAGVLAITKRRNSATLVICRTAKLIGSDHLTHARRRTLKGLVPYFGEPSRGAAVFATRSGPFLRDRKSTAALRSAEERPSKSEIINKRGCLLLE
jgi:hypothetical protein